MYRRSFVRIPFGRHVSVLFESRGTGRAGRGREIGLPDRDRSPDARRVRIVKTLIVCSYAPKFPAVFLESGRCRSRFRCVFGWVSDFGDLKGRPGRQGCRNECRQLIIESPMKIRTRRRGGLRSIRRRRVRLSKGGTPRLVGDEENGARSGADTNESLATGPVLTRSPPSEIALTGVISISGTCRTAFSGAAVVIVVMFS